VRLVAQNRVMSTAKRVAPFGSWPTPITSERVVRAAAVLSGLAVDDGDVWWSELRPEESGRTALVHRPVAGGGDAEDVLPAPWDARSRVHEYGGGAWWVHGNEVWFTHGADQRLYRLSLGGGPPTPAVPEPARAAGDRWADGVVAPDGGIVCVRERHSATGGEPRNEIVRIPAGGGEPEVLVTGPDFVSNPRLALDGVTLCWLQWDHPNMPWNGTELRVGPAAHPGPGELVAGGVDESVFQPEWGPGGALWFVSDRSGWWNLYRWRPDTRVVEPMVGIDADIGVPQWRFALARYAFLADGRVVFAYSRHGFDRLAVREADGSVRDLHVPHTVVSHVAARGSTAVYVGGSPTTEPEVVWLDVDRAVSQVLRPGRDVGLDRGWFSEPESLTFPTEGGAVAYGLFYPPTNPEWQGPAEERPPLLVFIHGGPTAAARAMLDLGVQYWTSRGFAVVDVNYRGSTGYGRAFRDALAGTWGLADVDDCVAAARWLADRGRVDPQRLCIRGGSAGGFTTMAALAFRDVFSAGASHFGVADLEALAKETHKFESRYLDWLVAPYPEGRDRYMERSPIHHVDGIDCPLIVFQGLEDEVVPPNQAEMIVNVLRRKGVPVAYVPFEGEQHGFRRAENIRRTLDSELSFYAQVLGFELPGDEGIQPVRVDNLPMA
jgi:dipeptidyl aminopeptidase/acylaminoacyl peptidase